MRGDQYKQMHCIEETNGELFELRMNEILKTVKNPEIILDHNKPFTAYIFYENNIDVPETITEFFELLTGERHTCQDCPHLIKSPDKRRTRQMCDFYKKIVHQNQPVCKTFYMQNFEKFLLTENND